MAIWRCDDQLVSTSSISDLNERGNDKRRTEGCLLAHIMGGLHTVSIGVGGLKPGEAAGRCCCLRTSMYTCMDGCYIGQSDRHGRQGGRRAGQQEQGCRPRLGYLHACYLPAAKRYNGSKGCRSPCPLVKWTADPESPSRKGQLATQSREPLQARRPVD